MRVRRRCVRLVAAGIISSVGFACTGSGSDSNSATFSYSDKSTTTVTGFADKCSALDTTADRGSCATRVLEELDAQLAAVERDIKRYVDASAVERSKVAFASFREAQCELEGLLLEKAFCEIDLTEFYLGGLRSMLSYMRSVLTEPEALGNPRLSANPPGALE